MNFIKHFSQISKLDTAFAGGKGASLGEMTQAGILVPPGFVVLSAGFEKFLEETDLNVEIDSILHTVNIKEMHTVENASEKIKDLILKAKMPKDVSEEIKKEFKNLKSEFVAVRSSATAEDSSSAAWAGQLDSFLNTTEKTLLANVQKCWASLFTPRAIFYRFEKGLHNSKISVAVVVQKMVQSEISGIAFSVHPVTQDHNQLIIEVGYGLGEAIVSGQITPDSYVIEKNPRRIIDKNISVQERGIYKKSKDGDGNEWQDIPQEKGERQKLTDKQILELSEIVIKIEKHYGVPQDIEWAYEKNKFYIMQSRPITTLGEIDSFRDKLNDLGNYDDYQRLFQWKEGGLPFLISDIFMDHYKNLNGLVTFANKTWINFIPRKIVKETLEGGLQMIKNTEDFEKYKNDFEDYKNKCTNFFKKIISKQGLSKTELGEFLFFLTKLFFYYSKTEFFYIDKAFEYSKKNTEIKRNLEKFDNIKNKGRKYLNQVFLGKNSYIEKLLNILSKKFFVEYSDLKFYSKEELIELFNNKKTDKKIIEKRKIAYVMQTINGKVVFVEGETAYVLINKFLHQKDGVEVGKIKGATANKGKVKGVVKIIEYGFENFHRMGGLIEKMKQGDILVADTTAPEIMMACKKASAIITNQGGLMSHAAIVSRELGIPCIVGTGNATEVLHDGDLVEVDADKGVVRIIKEQKGEN